MKKFALFVSISLITLCASAQDVSIKKDIIYVNEKECLKINDSDPNNVSIMDMAGNEIIFLKYVHFSKYGKVYNKITFLNEKLSFTSQSYVFTKKMLIKKLLADGTLSDCKLDAEKVSRFAMKFDENIEK